MRRRRTVPETRFKLFTIALVALLSRAGEPSAQSPTLLVTPAAVTASVSAPTLMWRYGGCLAGPFCQTGWYSSPAVADLVHAPGMLTSGKRR